MDHSLLADILCGKVAEAVEKRWEHFPHDADMGVRGVGRTLAEAFEQAALALTAVVTDPESVRAVVPVEIACEAEDPEALLFDWLNAVVYEMDTRDLLFARYEVRIEDGRLRATAWGEPVRIEVHQPAVEVKAATYTALRVAQDEAGAWTAQCVVDV
jgi:tRNA nucleotidyltransferase (CCA-adding enzyme)